MQPKSGATWQPNFRGGGWADMELDRTEPHSQAYSSFLFRQTEKHRENSQRIQTKLEASAPLGVRSISQHSQRKEA